MSLSRICASAVIRSRPAGPARQRRRRPTSYGGACDAARTGDAPRREHAAGGTARDLEAMGHPVDHWLCDAAGEDGDQVIDIAARPAIVPWSTNLESRGRHTQSAARKVVTGAAITALHVTTVSLPMTAPEMTTTTSIASASKPPTIARPQRIRPPYFRSSARAPLRMCSSPRFPS